MSYSLACKCPERDKPLLNRHWTLRNRHHHHSCFGGSVRRPSAYSTVECLVCRSAWRSKADFTNNADFIYVALARKEVLV